VLHVRTDLPIDWTTVNAGEAFPGVQTPLTWTFCGLAVEMLSRGGFARMGVFAGDEEPVPVDPVNRQMGIFFGQVAYNLDRFCDLGDRIPGSSGSAIEQQFFGSTIRPPTRPRLDRYAAVLTKAPIAVGRARRQLLRGDAQQYWSDAVAAPLPTRSAILDQMSEAFDWLAGMAHHAVLSLVAQGLWDQLHRQAARVGKEDLVHAIVADGAGSEEAHMVRDLWALSHDGLSLSEFIGRHGFHGPGKLDLATPSWRQDDQPLRRLAGTYGQLDDERSPSALQARQALEANEAERELLAALPNVARAFTRRLIGWARSYLRYREAGRCDLLRAADVARRGAHLLGANLARERVIDDAGDVFFLTWDELHTLPRDPRRVIAERRAQHEQYARYALPERWTGPPEPILVGTGSGATDQCISGVGASPGVAEGIARVIRTPNDEDELEPGEILVCRTTDPSWASYFLVADAVVIDIGGPLSHGAIVAREMGIPCVINTRNGTRVLNSGDRIRVDGSSGAVTILSV
jgi:phosphohistidine swiveling domain-containing protein